MELRILGVVMAAAAGAYAAVRFELVSPGAALGIAIAVAAAAIAGSFFTARYLNGSNGVFPKNRTLR